MAELADKGMPDTTITVVLPGGNEVSTQMIFDGQQDMGGSSPATVYEMVHGLGRWQDKPQPNRLRVLNVYTENPCPIVVREDSGVNTIQDLIGKSFAPGDVGSTTYAHNSLALKALGIDYKEFAGSLGDAVEAFKDRRIVGYIKGTTGHSIDATHIDIMSTTPIKFIGFTDEEVKKVQAKYPWIAFKNFPAGWFTQLPQNKAINVVSFSLGVIARDDFPEVLAYQWTKSVIDNFKEVQAVFAGSAAIDPLQTPQLLLPDVYLHPGAIRYYREIGVKVPESAIPPEMKK
jgi:TRAP transporter TAXI family solute receptor